MKLLDLDPLWLVFEGRRVGFMFRCPLPARRATEWQTCFFETFPVFGGRDDDADEPYAPRSQYGIVRASGFQGPLEHVQPCEKDCVWSCSPAPAQATFEMISVTPSLDGSKGGNWHGFVTSGKIVGGL